MKLLRANVSLRISQVIHQHNPIVRKFSLYSAHVFVHVSASLFLLLYAQLAFLLAHVLCFDNTYLPMRQKKEVIDPGRPYSPEKGHWADPVSGKRLSPTYERSH